MILICINVYQSYTCDRILKSQIKITLTLNETTVWLSLFYSQTSLPGCRFCQPTVNIKVDSIYLCFEIKFITFCRRTRSFSLHRSGHNSVGVCSSLYGVSFNIHHSRREIDVQLI